MIEKAVASAILYNADGEVLLQQRDDKPTLLYANYWTLFGGSVEDGETPDEAIYRELMEELELSLPLNFWQAFVCPVRTVPDVVTVHNHIFIGQMTRDLSDLTLLEGQAMRYFKPAEAADLKLAFDQHLILLAFLESRRL